MYKRYAKEDSWVIVTGGSDGIGFEICKQMAAQGFNICMVARNPTKMNEKIAEVKKQSPNVNTRTIVFDFAKDLDISDYKTKIADQVADIDIAMLYLNAGSS